MSANLLPSRPAVLGLSGGVLVATAALSLLGLLFQSAASSVPTMLLAAAGAGAAALLGSEAGGVSNYVGAMRTVSGNGGSRGGSKKHDDTLLSASKVASVEAGLLPIAFPGGGANGNGIHAHRNSQQLPGLEQRRAPAPASASTQQQQQQPTHPCCPHAPARDSSTIGARHLVRHSSGGQLGGARAALLVLGLRGRTALLGCCAAALTCCARGAQLAAALLRSGGDKGALMVPMALQGALGKGQRLVCACAWGGGATSAEWDPTFRLG